MPRWWHVKDNLEQEHQFARCGHFPTLSIISPYNCDNQSFNLISTIPFTNMIYWLSRHVVTG